MRFLFWIVVFVFVMYGYAIYADTLSDIQLTFCDSSQATADYVLAETGNLITYILDTDQSSDICYTLSNMSTEDVFVKVSFIDGTFTNDEWRNKACLSDTDIKYFGQYVTWYDTIIALSWWTTQSLNAELMYPAWSDGIYQGCLVYAIVDNIVDQNTDQTNFTILMRRAKFIDVLVWDYAALGSNGIVFVPIDSVIWENLSSNPYMRLYKDLSDGKYILQFTLENIWSLTQSVFITGTVSNFLTHKTVFIEPRIIWRWDSLLITKKLDTIPPYNMKIKLDITHQAYDMIYWIDNPTTPWKLSGKVNIIIFDTIFIITVIWLGLLLLLIILVAILLRRQKK
jgi:hypothetical protein